MKTLISTIGNTPMVQLNSEFKNIDLFGKLEMFSPTGSIKDRVALRMVEEAEKKGELKPGGVIVEATSGNMGTSLAMVGKMKGYRVILTAPDKTGGMKRAMMRALGAELVICPSKVSADSPEFYTHVAQKITNETEGAVLINQYGNEMNTVCHFETTGPEIWDQMEGRIDYFVACGGSGGSVSGCAQYLKQQDPNIKVIMPDPDGSIYFDMFHDPEGKPNLDNIHPYRVEGPGNPTFCPTMDFSVIDEMVRFTDEEALTAQHLLAKEQGVFAGDSSAAAYHVAKIVCKRLENETDKHLRVALLLPDTGMKYTARWASLTD